MTMKDECSLFEHTGWPTNAQAAEWLGLVANAITITIPVAAGLNYLELSHSGAWTTLLKVFLAMFGGVAVFWSWWLAYRGAKGANKRKTLFTAGAVAFGLCGFGLAGIAGTLLGRFMS